MESRPEVKASESEIQAQMQRLNDHLRELEGMLDDSQHAAVTDLLNERAVLGAMRARVELEEMINRKKGTK